MSSSILPHSMRLGTDYLTKEIISNYAAINIITLHLTDTEGDYIVGNNEWSDGSRSDVVLEPKSLTSSLTPIIIEIQQYVDTNFMKRAVHYCLQAFARYKSDPILLVICPNRVSSNVLKNKKATHVSGCYGFPSNFWAKECLILSKESLEVYEDATPLDPFVALGMFCTHSATSLVEANCSGDPTMIILYNLALRYQQCITGNQRHLIEVLKETLDTQEKEYEHLLKLVNNQTSPQVISEVIRTAQRRNRECKRKYNELDTEPSSSEETAIEHKGDDMVAPTTSKYITAMEFVKDFKQTRIKNGLTRMDWTECLAEGKKRGILHYKNSDSLRNQFQKYMKK